MKVAGDYGNLCRSGRCTFSDVVIVLVWYWAVIHDRPVSWAAKRANWPMGHRHQTTGRMRSIKLTENPFSAFADGLLQDREAIERDFGNLTNWGGGLNGVPAWIRTHPRVHQWTQAKLTLTALRRKIRLDQI